MNTEVKVEFSEENLLEDKTSWVYTNATISETGVITIQTGGKVEFTISGVNDANKSLRYDIEFENTSATEHSFKTNGVSYINIEYKNVEYKKENNFIVFNRDKEENLGVYKNTCKLALRGSEIKEITGVIYNTSTAHLVIRNIALHSSIELHTIQLAKVLKEETIQADIIQASGAIFSNMIFTQLLRTNVLSMLTTNAKVGDTVEYIDIQGWTQSFYTATLGTETEQLIMPVEISGMVTDVAIWYAVIEGDDAFKYFTTKSPLELYPEMPAERVDLFKVKVFKPSSLAKKLAIEFRETSEGIMTPVIIFGAGIGIDTQGQGFMYKDDSGMYFMYDKTDGLGTVGIVIDNEGVHIEGLTDQFCESIIFKDNGVRIKFSGEPLHSYEYVVDNTNTITGYIQDTHFLTTTGYEPGVL